jgi:lipoprotein-anchoring transpeptidase ErfK/SrfK
MLLAALGTLVPLAPILIGAAITSSGAGAQVVTTPGFTPVAPTQAPSRLSPTFPSAVPGGAGTLIAIVQRATTMRSAPSGPVIAHMGTRTEFGSPEVAWVVSHVPGWIGVVSPLAGNGRLGWIPAAAATLTRDPWQIKVSLSAFKLTVLNDGKVVQRYTIATGRPTAPTPSGRFAVTDRLQTGDPTGPYGCCILATSAHSPHAIQGWAGGDRIAIHSTPETSSIGQPVSHGCMRLSIPHGQWLMNHIPLGTPVLISS